MSSGRGLPIVSKILGHTQPAITARYAHLANDPVKSAVPAVASRVERRCEAGAAGSPLSPATTSLAGEGGRQKNGSVAWALPRGDLPHAQGRQRILHQSNAEGKEMADLEKGPAAEGRDEVRRLRPSGRRGVRLK